MDQFSRLLRNTMKLSFSVGGVGLSAVVTLVVALTNYLACQFAFELLGWERKPLITDELVGQYLGAFLPNATINHCFAFCVTVVLTISLFICFQILFKTFNLAKDIHFYRRSGDMESASAAGYMILWDLILLALLAPLLYWAIRWDLELFRWRSILGASLIETADSATQLLNFENQMKANGDLWAWSITKLGGWGYLTMTALSCLALEYSMSKTSEHFSAWMDTIHSMFLGNNEQGPYDNYTGYEDTAYQDVTPQTSFENSRYSNSEDSPDSQNGYANGYHDNSGEHSQTDPMENSEPMWDPSEARYTGNSTGANETTKQNSVNPKQENVLYDVIGSESGEKVDLKTARANSLKYWIENGEKITVWDLNYRNLLFGNNTKKAA